jgi:hypothetical protein
MVVPSARVFVKSHSALRASEKEGGVAGKIRAENALLPISKLELT